MTKRQSSVLYLVLLAAVVSTFALGTFGYFNFSSSPDENQIDWNQLKQQLSKLYFHQGTLPRIVTQNEQNFHLEYSFNQDLTSYITRLLKRYRSDFTSVVVIDNETGEILSSVGLQRRNNRSLPHLPYTNTHPAASIFKIITAAKLIDDREVTPSTVFSLNGRGTTLYKYQLKNRKNRWTRYLSLERAFAYSNNVVFGKAAINHLNGVDLYHMAQKFGFNQSLIKELDLSKSIFLMPTSQYNLAELSTGFNKETTMSPVHAAVIASIVANDGTLRYPTILRKIETETENEILNDDRRELKVLSDYTSTALQEMMEKVITRGTARGSFRHFKRSLKQRLRIGGKTGSITGGTPFGKRDWFVGYAKDEESEKGISIAVMNVNVNKWYVRSAYLTRKIMEYYFSKIDPIVK